MLKPRVWLAVSLLGALLFVGGIVAQTDKAKSVTIAITPGKKIIEVNLSDKCTKAKSTTVLPGDTVEWQANPSSISNFHLIFPESPFTNGETYFDKNHATSGTVANPDGDAEDFKYVIAVEGGHTCDPHVIIVKGRKGKGD